MSSLEKEGVYEDLVSQSSELSFSRRSSLHDYLQLNHAIAHCPDTSWTLMVVVSDHFPREPFCKLSGSRLFHKVCQRNHFLLTSLTINNHFWASKLELYVISNVRARFQSSQNPVFSHFKRCLGARDLESQFTSEFVQLWEFSLGSPFHTVWIEHTHEETAKNLGGDIIKNALLQLLFLNLLSFLAQIIFLESLLRVLENIKT